MLKALSFIIAFYKNGSCLLKYYFENIPCFHFFLIIFLAVNCLSFIPMRWAQFIFFEVHTLTLSLDKKNICCNNGEYRQLFPTIIMPLPLEFYVSHDKIRMPPTVEHNASLLPPPPADHRHRRYSWCMYSSSRSFDVFLF